MIEVGDYARIDKDFRTICIGIGKVVNKNQDTIYVKMSNNDLPISFNEDSIAKHSKELIDLIEVGDYVNGYEVGDVCEVTNEEIGKVIETDISGACGWEAEPVTIYKDEIKTILTKEQFASMEYKVEEDI